MEDTISKRELDPCHCLKVPDIIPVAVSMFSLLALFLLAFSPKSLANGKVKVFVLAGQSNMVGKGSIDHLDLLVANASEYRTALYEDGNYKTSENVYIKYGLLNSHGRLTVSRDSGYATNGAFGPELMFGFTVGCALREEKILLIKTAWGGKTLAVDFRPPSSGEGHYGEIKPIEYGKFYRAMIEDVLDTLENIEQFVPGEDEYELSGFVWFQGWNDMLNFPMVFEYEGNLVNFIRDVRLDLATPDLPFGMVHGSSM